MTNGQKVLLDTSLCIGWGALAFSMKATAAESVIVAIIMYAALNNQASTLMLVNLRTSTEPAAKTRRQYSRGISWVMAALAGFLLNEFLFTNEWSWLVVAISTIVYAVTSHGLFQEPAPESA